MVQPPGLQQAGGRVHQGIARHGGLAKNGSPYLIRRDEPPSGALPSNEILRFEKAANAHHVVFTDQRYRVRVEWVFYRYFGGCVCLVFPTVQARARALRFNPRVSCSP